MDKYAQAFAEAMEKTGTRNVTVSERLGGAVVYNSVSQWRTGRRPIPAEHAPVIAAMLGVAPETISRSYERYLRDQSAKLTITAKSQGSGAIPTGHIAIERLEDFGRVEGPDRIWLPEFLARRELGLSALENVRWTVQLSRGMEPEIRRYGLVLVDISAIDHHHVIDGGTYAFTLRGRPDIRRVSMRRDGWVLACRDEAIADIEVSDSELKALHIYGVVVGSL
jgi:DNA-binding transcriptional regulator YdaS (Cro superfamily)